MGKQPNIRNLYVTRIEISIMHWGGSYSRFWLWRDMSSVWAAAPHGTSALENEFCKRNCGVPFITGSTQKLSRYHRRKSHATESCQLNVNNFPCASLNRKNFWSSNLCQVSFHSSVCIGIAVASAFLNFWKVLFYGVSIISFVHPEVQSLLQRLLGDGRLLCRVRQAPFKSAPPTSNISGIIKSKNSSVYGVS